MSGLLVDAFAHRYSSARQPNRYTLWVLPTEGFAVSRHNEHSPQESVPAPHEPIVPQLEVDETIAPRPEEEIADALRAQPDAEDHSQDSQ